MRTQESVRPPVGRALLLLGLPFAILAVAWIVLRPAPVENESDLVAQASAALEGGDIDGAYEIVERLHESSDNPEVLYLLAVIEDLRGNEQRALDVIQQVSGFREDPRLLTMAAQFALKIPRLMAAREFLNAAIDRMSSNEEAIRLLANLEGNLMNSRRVRQLMAKLDGMGQCSAQDIFLFCSGSRVTYDLYENVDRLIPALANERNQGELVYALASNYLAMDRLAEAEKVIQSALDDLPEENAWMVYQADAELSVVRGDFARATTALVNIGAKGTEFSPFWLAAARVFRDRGQNTAAIDAYRNAAQLDPFDPEPVFVLSRLLSKSAPDEAEAFKQRSRILQQLSTQVESVITLSSLEEAVERFPVIVDKLVDAEAYREARVCLTWLKSEGYRSNAATEVDERLKSLVSLPPIQLKAPRASGLRDVDLTLLDLTPEAAGERSESASVKFEDATASFGLRFEYSFPPSDNPTILASLGGGVGVVDFDMDGHVDLFFPQAGDFPQAENRTDRDSFQRRRGDVFVDVSETAGIVHSDYGHGASVADVDSDGFPDLFVTNYGVNQLYLNNGDGTLREVGRDSGFVASEWSVSSAFGDFDKDGDVDLYVANYLVRETCRDEDRGDDECGPMHVPAVQDRLYENLGEGTFREITVDAGVISENGKGLGVVVRDFDQDGKLDLFVSNDTTQNRLFFNHSSAESISFEESSVQSGVAVAGDGTAEASMGIASDDLDGNGFPDIFVTNFEAQTNSLYSNIDGRTFVDETDARDLARSSYATMGWGTQLLDLNDDGYQDVVVLNGQLHDSPMRPQVYLNHQDTFTVLDVPNGDYFSRNWLGRGLALADLDEDGRPDLIATHRTGQPHLLLNRSGTQRSCALRLIGRGGARQPQGTRVTVDVDEASCRRVLHCGGGYLVANEQRVWLTIPAGGIAKLTVEWSSGRKQVLDDVVLDSRVVLRESETSTPLLYREPR